MSDYEQGIYKAGDVLLDRFEILGTLGKGGMGVVYRGLDKITEIEVAIKTIAPELSASGWEMEEIKENFKLVYKLHHPHIANYNSLERDRVTGNYFLVMEYVAGEDLRYYLRRQRKEGRFSEELVIGLVRQIAEALDYAHANKIIHRDIKPANIFVDRNGNIKLLDFGLAAQIHSSLSRVTKVTNNDLRGTVPYMSPEQWLCIPQKAPSDQYALAATLYEIFTGMPPFYSQDKDNIRYCVLNVEPAPLQNVSTAIAKAVAKALSKKPEERYPSCKAFADALAEKTSDYVAVQTVEAENRYRKAAEQGNAEAQAGFADCYYYGQLGLSKNYAEAVKWYRMAADQGFAYAQYSLGFCYEQGEGVTKDVTEAVNWYRKAAEQGYARAQCNLGCCYDLGAGVTKDIAAAVNWYRKSAEQGYALAQCKLGFCYEHGLGVAQDVSEAVNWYRKSAEQGYALAQSNLGVCYISGKGVTKDDSEAVRWFCKSAEQGNVSAQCNLGLCYELGFGVSKDVSEAVKWYRTAAAGGSEKAKSKLKAFGIE